MDDETRKLLDVQKRLLEAARLVAIAAADQGNDVRRWNSMMHAERELATADAMIEDARIMSLKKRAEANSAG